MLCIYCCLLCMETVNVSMYVGASRSYKTKCDRILKNTILCFLLICLWWYFTSLNCNLWIAYIHLFDTFPKISFWLMVDFLASGYYSVSCYFSIIHYFSLYRVRCCSILYHYHYVLCCHIIVWRDDNEDDMCVFSSYNKGVVIHFQWNRICTMYKSS